MASLAASPRQSRAPPSSPSLPKRGSVRGGGARCSAAEEAKAAPVAGAAASLLAAASVMAASNPALADGLSLGISNNLLGWILAGVFGLIWALYFIYTSTWRKTKSRASLSEKPSPSLLCIKETPPKLAPLKQRFRGSAELRFRLRDVRSCR
ncbi:unnamed protein product [Spirodela intermedia]|uniref:PSII 6.1 kDa protein n=1 Tax=Spirodela intermedia TaxID=51605 RepID=A0A7I8IZZ5_SPIIN|nr:unnamed protein product [Spirodela intermedia]CAA6662741.1 unnamed protein product [Spirodela intermedia]